MKGFARHLRLAERRAQAPYGRGPLGGGMFGGKAAPPPVVPISDAFWSTGGWWDLYNIVGVNGATYAAATAAQSASALGVFTPGSTGTLPVIYDEAIGGKRGLILDSTQPNYLRNDALAPIVNGANKTWSVWFDLQPNILNSVQHDQNIVSWGSDNSGAHSNKVNIQYNALGGGSEVAQSLSLIQSSGDLVTTENDLSQVVGFDYFRFSASYDGTSLSTYINGQLSAVVPTTWQVAALVITRFMWGAWAVNGVGFSGVNGYMRRLGVRALPATAPQMAAIDANMVGNDVTIPQTSPTVPAFLVAGASVINGTTDAVNGMGVRFSLAKYVQDHRLSWTSQGSPQGAYALRNTTATGGASAPAITTQISSTVTSRTKLIVVDLGDQEIDIGQTALQVEAAITLALHNIRTAVYAVAPQCDIAVNTIIPLFEAPLNTVCIAVNAQLPTIWSASDAEFPSARPLIRWDANTAIGGPSYVQANYSAIGDDHPNNTGYTLMGTALIAAVGARLNAWSPSH